MAYLTKTKVVTEKEKMTSDHLLRLVEESHKGFRAGEVTASLFIDAEAAFEKCWHNGVKFKANVTISFRHENPSHHHINSVTAMSIAL